MILVGSTIPAFAMSAPDWHWWLHNRAQITAAAAEHGHEVQWLAVLQVDARGLEPFRPLIDLAGDDVAYHSFSLDIGVDEWTTPSRLTGICTGRNLIIDHALRAGAEWIYFADSDIEAPDDILVRLLELDWPVCGAHVPTYCLDGSPSLLWAMRDWDVRQHWNTAGSLLVHRDVFRRVPWRHDPDADLTDDPATQCEMARLGFPPLVRHDVICHHHPDCIGPLEHRGHDLSVYR